MFDCIFDAFVRLGPVLPRRASGDQLAAQIPARRQMIEGGKRARKLCLWHVSGDCVAPETAIAHADKNDFAAVAGPLSTS